MATLRNKRKLAAVIRETQEEHPRNGQSRNTSVLRINEDYITQVFEEIEGRVTEKLSQEFRRTESRILGALSKLDEFLLNPQIRTHSGAVPGTFRNTNVENQGKNEDDSQSDPHPEAGIFRGQTKQNSGSKECRDSDLLVLTSIAMLEGHHKLWTHCFNTTLTFFVSTLKTSKLLHFYFFCNQKYSSASIASVPVPTEFRFSFEFDCFPS